MEAHFQADQDDERPAADAALATEVQEVFDRWIEARTPTPRSKGRVKEPRRGHPLEVPIAHAGARAWSVTWPADRARISPLPSARRCARWHGARTDATIASIRWRAMPGTTPAIVADPDGKIAGVTRSATSSACSRPGQVARWRPRRPRSMGIVLEEVRKASRGRPLPQHINPEGGRHRWKSRRVRDWVHLSGQRGLA